MTEHKPVFKFKIYPERGFIDKRASPILEPGLYFEVHLYNDLRAYKRYRLSVDSSAPDSRACIWQKRRWYQKERGCLGTIHMPLATARSVRSTVAHELTHALFMWIGYKGLSKIYPGKAEWSEGVIDRQELLAEAMTNLWVWFERGISRSYVRLKGMN